MQNIKKIKLELSDLDTLKNISRMYAEIASGRMKKARDGVITSRSFLEKVRQVFNEVHAGYLKKNTRSKQITFIPKNGKKVLVFLSSNTGLYGDITRKTLNSYLVDLNETKDDAVIIGRFGLALFLGELPNHPYTFFALPDNKIDESDFGKIIRHLVEYEEIRIHYPKFESVITQNPDIFKISAATSLASLQADVGNAQIQTEFIFEPTIEDLLAFFESQMFSSLLEQTVRESQLAKFAARILAMDRAFDNISDKLSTSRKRYVAGTHRVTNKKQIENLTSVIAINAKY